MTFILLSYNQEHFIREAIEGALSQTYSPLEIIFSDDCSTDSSFEIFREAAASYKGPHRIILNRNKDNMGMGGHLNNAMELANGEMIVVAAGDDVSLPERVSRIREAYELSDRKAKSIFSDSLAVDEAGNVLGVPVYTPMESLSFQPMQVVFRDFILTGCSHAWSKEVFDVFGPLSTPIVCEDMVIPFRSCLLGEITYIDQILVKHRRHRNNIWNHDRNINVIKNIKHERFWIFEQKNIFRNWISDINKMKEVTPSRIEEWEHLEDIVLKRMASNEKELSLFSGSFFRKIMTIAGITIKERSWKQLRHQIGFFLLPGIYRRYMMLKSRRIKA